MSRPVRLLRAIGFSIALLLAGFGAGWVSSTLLGGQLPLPANVARFLGPGLIANQSTPASLRSQFGVFWETWNLVDSEFYGRSNIDHTRMVQGAIKGMLASLQDQYTTYQEPDLAAQTNDYMRGTLAGIGAYLRVNDGRIYLQKVFPGSPAERAGLKKDDEIAKVDDVDIPTVIAGLDTNQASVKAMKLLRGEEGTQVRVTYRRAGAVAPVQVTITRATIVVPSVESATIAGGLAYIRVSEFKSNTTDEFDRALRALLPAKPRGLILDLRNNPGGYLVNAQEMLGRLYSGVALYEETGAGEIRALHTIDGETDVRAYDLPLVVLINAGSASASEIVAGALRDSRPNTFLLGEKSFGKGSVQNIHTLSDGGSARITFAHWLTPNRTAIHKVGITPGYIVPYTEHATDTAPCIADRTPPAGRTTCADSQLASAIRLLSTDARPLGAISAP